MSEKEESLLDKGAVIIKSKDGNYHQVLLTKDEENMVMNFIERLHQGSIRVSSVQLEGIEF